MRPRINSRWLGLIGLLILLVQAGTLAALVAGRLGGSTRNLAPQVLLGGFALMVIVSAHFLSFQESELRPPSVRFGIVFLVALALCFVGYHFYRIHSILTLRYDLGSWSEPMFLIDIIKSRLGVPLYGPLEDGNSNAYTFAAPAVTYFLAWLLRHPISIPLFRLIQQFYLVLASLFAAAATRNLVRLAAPEKAAQLSRWWVVFFALGSFLFATNSETASFNIFLHNEPMVWLVSAIAFWLMLNYALTLDSRWLWAMTVAPTAAFLVKQNLLAWAAVYLLYLWFDERTGLRRLLVFAIVSAGLFIVGVGVCVIFWGRAFLECVFGIMAEFPVSIPEMIHRLADPGWHLALGFASGLALLQSERFRPLLGLWVGWLVLALSGIYTMGTAPYATYLGPASLLAGCFFFAALVKFWPAGESPAAQWLRMTLAATLVLAVFAGLGHVRKPLSKLSPDFSRYVQEIAEEFRGLPTDRVLLDLGEWIYLGQDVLRKDEVVIAVTPRTPRMGLLDRIRRQEYRKILAHQLADGTFLYDQGLDRGIGRNLQIYYHPVRRILRVKDMQDWRYGWMTMSDIVVFEPNSAPVPPRASSPSASSETR